MSAVSDALDALRATATRISAEELAGADRLGVLAMVAEHQGDYARYDEKRHDELERSETRLGELLMAVRVYLLTVRE